MMAEIYGVAGSGKTTYVSKQEHYKAVRPGFLLKLRTFFFISGAGFLFLSLEFPFFFRLQKKENPVHHHFQATDG